LDVTKQRRIDSLLNADINSDAEREFLRKKILEIFQDSDEGKKVLSDLDKEDEDNPDKKDRKGRRNSDPTSKNNGNKKKGRRSRSYDGDNDSEPYTPKGRNSDEGYDSSSDGKRRKNKKSGSANTETSGVGTDDDLEERNSIEFIDFDSQTDVSPRRKRNNQVGLLNLLIQWYGFLSKICQKITLEILLALYHEIKSIKSIKNCERKVLD
jgi:hypothetical protein